MRLHVNIDHVATLRKARGTNYPDPVHAAVLCEKAGAHGITVHLREDRRHIEDRDVRVLKQMVRTFLNLEMGATDEMLQIALEVRPDLVTLVPERREERTTEGGLDVRGQLERMKHVVKTLGDAGIPVSMFIAPSADQIDASVEVGAHAVEFHTGEYAHAVSERPVNAKHIEERLAELEEAVLHAEATAPNLVLAAGHGLSLQNLPGLVNRLPQLAELNIGHALIADAVFHGLEETVRLYLDACFT